MPGRSFRFISLILAVIFVAPIGVAADDLPIKIFGYFQTEFRQDDDNGIARNSFLTQQLNMFLQKELGQDWRSFVNFEIVNSYSSLKDWGSFNLEEAWVGYRASEQFNLKLGLQIPEFNNLNTIKNRTPLLPYIIRPLVYETSFGEFINLDVITPARAFVQAYGYIASADVKFDYAAYLGNSPNVLTSSRISNEPENSVSQSGTDTTNTFSVGGRAGVRYGELKAGLSATHERLNDFPGMEKFLGGPPSRFLRMPLNRTGADLSFNWRDWSLEGEYIFVNIGREFAAGIEYKIDFYYVTLGYYLSERLFAYGSLSQLKRVDFRVLIDRINPPADTVYLAFDTRLKVDLPTFGFSYNLNDRVTFKGQVVLADISEEWSGANDDIVFNRFDNFLNRYALAVSAFF